MNGSNNQQPQKQKEFPKSFDEHEYELIPVSPLRKLEKRMDEVEKQSGAGGSKEFYRELVEIIRMNQQLVDELAKANDALRIELSRLPSRLEDMIAKLDEMVSFIKASAGEDIAAGPSVDTMKPVLDKLGEIVESNRKIVETNQGVVEALNDVKDKMKRPLPPPPGMIRRPPLFPPKQI
jgi:methyl-accepting chemotaxis protein